MQFWTILLGIKRIATELYLLQNFVRSDALQPKDYQRVELCTELLQTVTEVPNFLAEVLWTEFLSYTHVILSKV